MEHERTPRYRGACTNILVVAQMRPGHPPLHYLVWGDTLCSSIAFIDETQARRYLVALERLEMARDESPGDGEDLIEQFNNAWSAGRSRGTTDVLIGLPYDTATRDPTGSVPWVVESFLRVSHRAVEGLFGTGDMHDLPRPGEAGFDAVPAVDADGPVDGRDIPEDGPEPHTSLSSALTKGGKP